MDNFIGYFRKVTTNRLKVNSQLEIGNKAIFAGTGTTYYVDSDASNAADTNSGRSWARPLATISGAIAKCTANQGDTIILAESHSETYTDTGAKFVASVAGITIIGLGEGSDRATLTFSHTGATTTISGANVTIYNVLFVTGVDQVVTFGTISGADCKLINCETRDATGKDAIDAFTVTTTADRLYVFRHKHKGDPAADQSQSIFNLTGADDFVFEECSFMTKCGTGIIELASQCLNGIIDKCNFYVDSTSNYSKNVVDTAGTSTVIINDCFDLEAMGKFSGGNNGSGFSVAGDDVGTVLTNLATVDTNVDSILVDTGTTLPGLITSKIPDIVTKSVSSVANGNTNLFSITGEIEIESIYGLVTTGTEDAACTLKFDFTDGVTDTDICTATSIQNKGAGTNLTISGTFSDALAVTAGNLGQGQARKINLSGEGTGYIRSVASAAITGEITFYCKYKKMSSDGAVAAV